MRYALTETECKISIATRYEKRAANFLAFVKLAAIRLWLCVYEFTAYLFFVCSCR